MSAGDDQRDSEPAVIGYDLMAFNEKNVNILIDRIRELQKKNEVTFKQVWAGAGISKDKSESSLSRWVNREVGWDTIGRAAHEKIVHWLIAEKHWYADHWEETASEIPDFFYHAVTGYLGIGHATKENIRRRASGVFRVYHPSLLFKGRYVVGAAALDTPAGSEAVRVREYFRYKTEDDRRFVFREIDEAYDGYVFRKSKKYFFLLKDRERTHMRMEVFPDTFGIERDIKMLRGAVMSISENRGFYAPIYYEKIDPAKGEKLEAQFERMKAESNIYGPEDIPEIVRVHLDSIPPSLFG